MIGWLLYVEGSFQFFDGGRLDLGVVRDSLLDATNDYETFVEPFETVAFRGIEAYQVQSTVAPTGAKFGDVDRDLSRVALSHQHERMHTKWNRADDGDADREEFEALIALGDDGVDVTEAIGDIHDRRAARDADFQSLVGPLMESAGIQVVWRASDDDEARSERLAGARRWQFLGKDPITGAVRLHHPEGFTELHYPDGTVDHIEDGFSPGWSRRPAREASAGPAVARGTGTGAVIRSRSNLSAMSETGRQRHRTYVGGGDYDLKGAMQLTLLYSLGLRAEHRLLDIGCGSLRAGRFIIPYLNAGGYTGLEPNTWLIDEAIEKEIGRDVLDIKKPIFVNNDQFDVSGVGEFTLCSPIPLPRTPARP